MRINQTKRIFMNEADSSSGNGAPIAPPAPAAPTAAPTAPEQPAPLTADAVATIVAQAVDTKLKAFENGLFANARKAGLLKKDETPSAPAAAPAPTGLTAVEVEQMLERERVVTRVATEHKLTEAQVKRMKGLLAAEKPEDVSGWVSSFVADMGFARPSEPATPAPVPVVPSAAPISDRGAPTPNGATGWRFEAANPIGMSKESRAAMDAELGAEKARKMRLEAARVQAETLRVVRNPQR